MKKLVIAIVLAMAALPLFSQTGSPPPEAPPAESRPPTAAAEINPNVSIGLVGLGYFSDVAGTYRILPSFGPFFRVSLDLLRSPRHSDSGNYTSYLDVGGIAYVNVISNASVSSAPVYCLGIGASVGLLNQVITFSPGVSWMLNESINQLTFSIIVTSSSLKL